MGAVSEVFHIQEVIIFEAFKIGVKLSLVNEVSHGLVAMASDFNRAEHAADSLRSRLASMATSTKLMFGGALAMGAGAAMLMAFKPALDEARKFQTEQANFRLFGMDEKQNQEAFSFAKNMDIAGSSYIENLKKMTEAQGAFRESGLKGSDALAGAKLAAPMLARLATVAKAQGHEMSESDDKALIRAIEMSGGLKDAKTFNSRADAIFKLVGSSGGMVKYEDIRAFYARGGVSAKQMTEDALMKFEPIIGEMKGTSAGTALMTSFNRLNGIVKLPNQIMHELIDAGLWKQNNIDFNSQGGAKNIRSEGLLKGADMLQSDPVMWEKTYLEPMYAKMGLITQKQKDVENARIFGRTGGAEFSLIQQQAAAIERSPDAIRKRQGINQSAQTMNQTFNGQLNIASAAWRDVLNNIGTAILPNVTAGLTTLTGILTRMADWTRDNPELVKAVAYTALFLSGLLIVGGALLMFGGVLALVGWPITLATIAIGLLGTAAIWLWKLIPWQTMGTAIKDAGKAFLSFFSDLWTGIGNLWSKLKAILPSGWFSGATPGPPSSQADPNGHGSTVGGDGSSKYVRTKAQAPIVLHNTTTLDGKVIAQNTANIMADGITSHGGYGGFDHGMTQATPAQSY